MRACRLQTTFKRACAVWTGTPACRQQHCMQYAQTLYANLDGAGACMRASHACIRGRHPPPHPASCPPLDDGLAACCKWMGGRVEGVLGEGGGREGGGTIRHRAPHGGVDGVMYPETSPKWLSFGTCVKIGTIQRRIAWSLGKDEARARWTSPFTPARARTHTNTCAHMDVECWAASQQASAG